MFNETRVFALVVQAFYDSYFFFFRVRAFLGPVLLMTDVPAIFSFPPFLILAFRFMNSEANADTAGLAPRTSEKYLYISKQQRQNYMRRARHANKITPTFGFPRCHRGLDNNELESCLRRHLSFEAALSTMKLVRCLYQWTIKSTNAK